MSSEISGNPGPRLSLMEMVTESRTPEKNQPPFIEKVEWIPQSFPRCLPIDVRGRPFAPMPKDA